jgi:DUF4097 and DUF4098 domain-containing protein YvlB
MDVSQGNKAAFIHDCKTGDLHLQTCSGKIHIYNSTIHFCSKLLTFSGDITLKNSEFGMDGDKVAVNTSMGNIHIEQCKGKFNFYTLTGDLYYKENDDVLDETKFTSIFGIQKINKTKH